MITLCTYELVLNESGFFEFRKIDDGKLDEDFNRFVCKLTRQERLKWVPAVVVDVCPVISGSEYRHAVAFFLGGVSYAGRDVLCRVIVEREELEAAVNLAEVLISTNEFSSSFSDCVFVFRADGGRISMRCGMVYDFTNVKEYFKIAGDFADVDFQVPDEEKPSEESFSKENLTKDESRDEVIDLDLEVKSDEKITEEVEEENFELEEDETSEAEEKRLEEKKQEVERKEAKESREDRKKEESVEKENDGEIEKKFIPATEKQKNYLGDMMKKAGFSPGITQAFLEVVSREEASLLIDILKSGRNNEAMKFVTDLIDRRKLKNDWEVASEGAIESGEKKEKNKKKVEYFDDFTGDPLDDDFGSDDDFEFTEEREPF
jgi:hypothetical protein